MIASTWPRSRYASAVCSVSARLPSIARRSPSGANPMCEPGSAKIMSAIDAKLPSTWPVDGLLRETINACPLSRRVRAASVVFAICISESTPSCIRAPPDVTIATQGIFLRAASSSASVTFSPTTTPIDPPRKLESSTIITTDVPPMEHVPVTAASDSPVRVWFCRTRTRYEIRGENSRGSSDWIHLLVSLKLPSSAMEAIRRRAEIV